MLFRPLIKRQVTGMAYEMYKRTMHAVTMLLPDVVSNASQGASGRLLADEPVECSVGSEVQQSQYPDDDAADSMSA